MVLSDKLAQFTRSHFSSRTDVLSTLLPELEQKLTELSANEALLMRYLYATLPLRDLGEYPFELFLSYVRHSLAVRDRFAWSRNLPEDIFLHDVLYPRVNTENLEDCRPFFYKQLIDRVRDLDPKAMALEVNYWLCEHATYEATNFRTASPLTTYRSGKGRCGEESTFAVTAYRALGMPARQVYTPWWAHCDDNHAWVEVYIQGDWYFLGACEPEEVLNKGWFSHASSRAMLVHTRNFSGYNSASSEESLGSKGMLYYYNDTSRYARTRRVTFVVQDAAQRPLPGVSLDLELLNSAEYATIAELTTDARGEASITLGLGDLRVTARQNGHCAEQIFDTADGDRFTLTLNDSAEAHPLDTWITYDLRAPEDYPVNPVHLTHEQKIAKRDKVRAANAKREARIAASFDAEKAARYPEAEEILRLAAGNFNEIYQFLSRDADPDRLALLQALPDKDYKDARADILESHLVAARPYRDRFADRRELYVRYILNPRVEYEEQSTYREPILHTFSASEQDAFRADPEKVWTWIKENISYHPECDYPTIVATPVGALRLHEANPRAQKILFVAILRTLGIPARLNPVDGSPEYHNGERFVRVDTPPDKKSVKPAVLTLCAETPEAYVYNQTWTLGRWDQEREHFQTLDYHGLTFDGQQLALTLEPGLYRIITTSRLPSGNQLAAENRFELSPGEAKTLNLKLRRGNIDDLLVNLPLDDFDVRKDNRSIPMSDLAGDGANLLLLPAVGEEPTEHVFNELLAHAAELNASRLKIWLILNEQEDLRQTTLQKVIKNISGAQPVFAAHGEIAEPLARRMYVDPDKLPLLIAACPGLIGIYASAGYNTGSVDLALKLLRLKQEQ